MIEIKDLTKIYPDGTKALSSISFQAQKNKVTGLIGFNGSGKTTTFNILVNFIESFKGDILFDGKKPSLEILRQISYLAAGSEPKNNTKVKEHLFTLASMHGADKKWTEKMIKHYVSYFEVKGSLNTKIKSLSKGNQQKVKLISVLLNPHSKYMFLDEPFDGLDPLMIKKAQKVFMEKSKTNTIIITSHRMEVVQEMCDEFYLLKEGLIVDAKKTSDREVIIRVNKEVPLSTIKKMKEVKSTASFEKYNELVIIDMKSFKKVNAELIKSRKYVYSSYIEKNIADSVFDKYREAVK